MKKIASRLVLALALGMSLCTSPGVVYASSSSSDAGDDAAMGVSSLDAQASVGDVFSYQGSSETSVYYTVLTDDTVAVGRQSTTGELYAVDATYAGELTIPATVSHDGNTYTVTEVSAFAFSSASKDNKVVVYRAVEGLTCIHLPATVKSVGNSAFRFCSGLTSVDFGDDSQLESIGSYAFGSTASLHANLASITLPKSLVYIGGYAFRGNPLETIVFQGDTSQITFASNTIFSNCDSIQTILYEGNSENTYDFTSDPEEYYLVRFYSDAENTSLISSAYVKRGTVLKNLSSAQCYQSTVPAIPQDYDAWFSDGLNFESEIRSSCDCYPIVRNAYDLLQANIVFDDTGYSYTGAAIDLSFSVYDSSGELIDPSGYSVVYYRQDDSGTWIETSDLVQPGVLLIELRGNSPYINSVSGTISITAPAAGTLISVDGITYSITVPASAAGEGQVSVGSGVQGELAVAADYSGALTIPSSIQDSLGFEYQVTSIAPYAFGAEGDTEQRCTGIITVNVPSTVASIGEYAFAFCSTGSQGSYEGIRQVLFEDNSALETIGAHAFQSARSLTDIVIPKNVSTIEEYAFYSCSSLVQVVFENGSQLSYLGEAAFAMQTETLSNSDSYCSLMSIEFPSQLAMIPRYCCMGQSKLASVAFAEEELSSIEKYAFAYCTSLTSIVLPPLTNETTKVGFEPFAGCTSLVLAECLGDMSNLGSVSQFSSGIWSNVSNLQKVIYHEKAASIYSRPNDEMKNYYHVRFYATEQDALAGENMIGDAFICEGTKLSDINSDLEAVDSSGNVVIYRGEIPEYVDDVSGWTFEGASSPESSLSDSCYAYAESRTNLSYGSITVDQETYTIKGSSIYPIVTVKDNTGSKLVQGTDYQVSYYNEAGKLVSDLNAAGKYSCVATGIGSCTGSISTSFTVKEASCEWIRLAGADRYETMSAIVSEGFATSQSEYAVVCTGENFPDALAASALAGMLDAPIIVTEGDTFTQEAHYELRRCGASNVIIIGGESSVSNSVKTAIEDVATVRTVSRLTGADRCATSLNILTSGVALGSWSDTVIIATGQTFADGLSISPYAYATQSPVVLAQSDGTLSAEAVSAILSQGFTKAIIVGGENSVSSSVENQLSSLQITRLFGQDRYVTSLSIAAFAVEQGVLSCDSLGLATGSNFPDALVGGALCGSKSSVLLLVGEDNDSQERIINLVEENIYDIETGYVFGGTSSIDESLVVRLSALWDK